MITSQDQQQWGYLLDPCFQIVNTAGKPVTNGYIEVYNAGTRVKYYCASDFNGTLHPFQIPLDSLGSNIVLADPANSYDIYVYNAFGTLLMSRYNVKVSAATSGGGGLPTQYEAEHWLGQYGATQVLEGNERGQTLALPSRPDYQGDFIDHISYGHINGDETNEYPKYMYLKPGLYLVNCVIRFQQQRGTEVNRLDELLVYTGNGNANEDVAWQLDETGPLANTDRHCLKLTFIRKVLAEGESSTVDCNNTLYFAPAPQVNWSDAYIQNLQIVKLDSKGGAGTQTYIPGDYVSIVGNVISVTGVLPESATGDFVKYEEFNTEIQNIHNEIDNLEITVQNATAQIVEQTTEIVTAVVEEVAPPMVTSIIERELAGVTGDFATRDELESATGNLQDQIDNIQPGVQADWDENDPEDPAYIQNKPDLDIYATKDELQSATSEIINVIETVTGNVPTGAVTHEELENATSVLQNEIDNIPAQVQSDWTQSATGEPDYIKNKPDIIPLVAGQNISINEVNGEIVISAEGVTGNYIERDELENVTSQIESEIENVTSQIPSDVVTHAELEAATANIPAQVQSDWTEADSSDPSYIQNKPNELSLVEGTNIHITKSGNEVIISADNGATGAVTQSELATATANLQSEIETVTGDVIDTVTALIPDAQVQSDWTESDTSDPSYIQNKPSEKTLVEGENVHITASGDYIVISADGGQVTGDYVERNELEAVTADVLDQATGAIPAQVQSDWTQTVTGDPSYIQNKPDTLPLVAGDNVTINEVNGEIVIAAQGGVTGDFVETSELEAATAEIQAEIVTATAQIPSPVVINYGDTLTGNLDLYNLTSQNSRAVCVKVPYNQLPDEIKNKVFYDASNYVYLWYKSQFLEPYGSDYSPRWVFETVLSAPNFKYPTLNNSAYILRVHTTSNGSSWSIDSIKLADNQVVIAHVTVSGTYYPNATVTSDISATDFINAWAAGKAVYAIDTSHSNEVYTIISGADSANSSLYLATTNTSRYFKQLSVNPSGWYKYYPDYQLATTDNLTNKQDKLTAGDNITISSLNVISGKDWSTDIQDAIESATGDIQDEIVAVTAAINTVTGMIPDLDDLNTAGITDIQVVNALPASPVATVLYLVRE